MRYLQQHINTITESYKGDLPLAHFLKNYFKQYPILGSRDRKILSGLLYSYYRAGHGFEGKAWFDELSRQWFSEPKKFSDFSLHQWINGHKQFSFDINGLFPYNVQLSDGIERNEWPISMLTQPELFIRIHKNKVRIVKLLNDAGIPYSFVTDTCLALPNGAKIDALLPADTYVVQDASSQRTGSYFKPKKGEQWYDCCAGAGGKSLLLMDAEPGVRLTVSDRRESIIHNLKQRFHLYGHKPPESIVVDVADKAQLDAALKNRKFDNIICDAPCSGSGTWARTPEQLYFFAPASVEEYSSLQRSIAGNVSRFLAPGGRLIYITCSIFRQENEDVVSSIENDTSLKNIDMQIINGTGIKADSMFVSVLQ